MKPFLYLAVLAFASSSYAQVPIWKAGGEVPIAPITSGLSRIASHRSEFNNNGLLGSVESSAYTLFGSDSLLFSYTIFNSPSSYGDPQVISTVKLDDLGVYKSILGDSLNLHNNSTVLFSQSVTNTFSGVALARKVRPSYGLGYASNGSPVSANPWDDATGFQFEFEGSSSSLQSDLYRLVPGATTSTLWMLAPKAHAGLANGSVVSATSEAGFTYLAPVPEPGLMIAAGLGALAVLRRRKANKV